jgi:hypothetical protein
MGGIKLYSPSNPPPGAVTTPKREFNLTVDSTEAAEQPPTTTPTSGRATMTRARMGTPRARPSRPAFTPTKPVSTEPIESSPIQVTSPTAEKAAAEAQAESDAATENGSSETENNQSSTESHPSEFDSTTTSIKDNNDVKVNDEPTKSAPASAAVNFFTDGFKVDTAQRSRQSEPNKISAIENALAQKSESGSKQPSPSTSRPISARASLFESRSSESPKGNITPPTAASNVKPVAFVQSSFNPLLPQNTQNNNDDDDDDGGLFMPSKHTIQDDPFRSNAPSLSALTKNVDFLDFESSTSSVDAETSENDATGDKSASNPTKPSAANSSKGGLFFSPLSSQLPKGMDDTPIVPPVNTKSSSPATPISTIPLTKQQPLFFGLKSATESKVLAAEQADRAASFSPNSTSQNSVPLPATSSPSNEKATNNFSSTIPSAGSSDNSPKSSLFDRPAASAVLTDVLGVKVDTRRNDLFD